MADSTHLDRSIAAALAAAQELTRRTSGEGTAPENAATDQPVEGVGESADGLVRAIAVLGGQIDTLWIDPQAMRLGSEALAEKIRSATNAALADLRAKLAGTLAAPDTSAMLDQLKELQRSAVPQLQNLLDTLAGIQERIARTGRVGQ